MSDVPESATLASDVDAEGITWATSTRRVNRPIPRRGRSWTKRPVLDELDRQPPKALIFRSGKSAGFIAGADIQEFTQPTAPKSGANWSSAAGTCSIAWLPCRYPTLALVRGHCLGGGLELALACRYPLAVDEPGTKMGSAGSHARHRARVGRHAPFARRVGPGGAMDMMLTGKTIDAPGQTHGAGRRCVPPRVDGARAQMMVLSNALRHQLPVMQKLLNGPLKSVVANGARKQVAGSARPQHYPAPYAIIDIWAKYNGQRAGRPGAASTSHRRSPTARNLVRVFFLQERLKSFGKDSTFGAKRVHVVGAVSWVATLPPGDAARHDGDAAGPESGADRARRARAARISARRIKDRLQQVRAIMDRLIPDPDGLARHADVVIEAIFENPEAKRALCGKLDAVMRPDAVLAPTRRACARGSRTVLQRPGTSGRHPLLQPGGDDAAGRGGGADGADAAMVQAACAFVRQIDKLPLPVRSEPGFLVNAVLAPYMLEAMRAVDEGISRRKPSTRRCLAFGMPMGPVELADTVGPDICRRRRQATGGGGRKRRAACWPGRPGPTGKKTGQGFGAWTAGKAHGRWPERRRRNSPPAWSSR